MSTLIASRRPVRLLVALLAAGGFAGLLAVSFQRLALNYGNETDFLGGFVPEAARLLSGNPPLVAYHPPLYAAVVAVVYRLTGDWLRAGLLISLAASFASVFACFRLFDVRYGRTAAVGAVAALCVSGPFISYSLQATSDIFFLALFLGAMALLAVAEVRGRPRAWLWGGFVTGLAALTRTNGVATMGFLVSAARNGGQRSRALALALLGAALPLAIWFAASVRTGSPFFPRYNYENLALTYYAEGDRTSGDALHQASAGMSSTWDVLSRKPRRVVRIYFRDLMLSLQNLFVPDLLPFPFSHLALPGLCVFLLVHRERFDWVVPGTLAAMFLLLNLKAWESRYYLFLVPFMGAGIALALAHLHALAARAGRTRPLAWALAVSIALGAVETVRGIRRERSDLSFDAMSAGQFLASYRPPAGSVVVARKPHVCFYSGLECESFPDVERLEDLRASLAEVAARRPPEVKVFLFYGFVEKELRPGLMDLHGKALEVPWLQRIAVGKENRKWVVFEVVREALEDQPAESAGVSGDGLGNGNERDTG